MLRQIILLILLVSACSLTRAAKFNADSTINLGIRQIYSLQFDKAEESFRRLIAEEPTHPAGRFFLAMIDWWRILVDLNNEQYDDLFFQKLEDVIYQCDKILDEHPDNVEALFFKGGAIGFRGRLHAVRESWLKAADDGRAALPIVEKASKLDPNNKDVLLGFGLYNYYAAVIPEDFPLVKPLMIFFPKGDKEQGIQQLTEVAQNGRYARVEARYFLMTLYSNYEHNSWKAKQYAEMLTDEFPDNSVFKRWRGRVHVQLGETDKYVSTYREIYQDCLKKKNGYEISAQREAVYYLGVYYKSKHDIDSAKMYLAECLKLSEKYDKSEESGFIVNSTLFLGMLHDAANEREAALACYKRVTDMKDFQNSQKIAKSYIDNPYKW
ncbi:MAG: hypothetical protein LWX56_04595 [Ignavibacteria bacterium]|nr:hypothetical protein [Ignavibacteria bacterium]